MTTPPATPPPYAIPPESSVAATQGADRAEKLRWAKYAGIGGGAILVVSGLFMGLIFGVVAALFGAWATEPSVDEGAGVAAGIFAVFGLLVTVLSVGLGVVVLVGATKFTAPNGRTWAFIVLGCGIGALVTGGGLLIGPLLAITSGILAIMALPS